MSHCHTVTLSHCHTVTLSHCHTVILSHCHTVILSYCHTVTLSHCQIEKWKKIDPLLTQPRTPSNCPSVKLTDAALDVGVIAPGPVPPAVDGCLVLPGGRVAPALPATEVLDGRGVRPGVHSVHTSPVGHPQVILVDGEGSLSAVDG